MNSSDNVRDALAEVKVAISELVAGRLDEATNNWIEIPSDGELKMLRQLEGIRVILSRE